MEEAADAERKLTAFSVIICSTSSSESDELMDRAMQTRERIWSDSLALSTITPPKAASDSQPFRLFMR